MIYKNKLRLCLLFCLPRAMRLLSISCKTFIVIPGPQRCMFASYIVTDNNEHAAYHTQLSYAPPNTWRVWSKARRRLPAKGQFSLILLIRRSADVTAVPTQRLGGSGPLKDTSHNLILPTARSYICVGRKRKSWRKGRGLKEVNGARTPSHSHL